MKSNPPGRFAANEGQGHLTLSPASSHTLGVRMLVGVGGQGQKMKSYGVYVEDQAKALGVQRCASTPRGALLPRNSP